MSNEDRPHVVSAVQVRDVELIDTGHTLAVRLTNADGTETAVLLPLATAAELIHHVAEAFAARNDDAEEPAEGVVLSPARS